MTRSRLITDMVREILHTKKRFLSLFVMSFLAVGFLAGLRMTAPDMQTTMDHYYDRQRFMDVRLISMLGLTEEDLAAAAALPGVSAAVGSRSFDALLEEDSVTVFSIPQTLNLLDLVEGRMPETPSECITEVTILEAMHKEIGDTITIDTKESFNSVMQDDSLDTTGFVALPAECFTQDYYSQIFLELEGLAAYNCYRDDAYEEHVDAFIEEIKPFAKERARIRSSQVSEDLSFADLAALIISGIAESGSSGASAMEGLTGSNGDWYILGRDTIRSYVEFSEDSSRMSDLANVFPLIFFMVAALSSLTSMTRMVEDHRAEIGTLKSLGFSTMSISIKYIGYALAASLLGGGIGLIFGGIALPSLIYWEWGIMYMLPKLEVTISPIVALYSVGAAVLATAGAAYAACYATLLSKPAELLRPRAPKPGKRIFLEYIPFIWKRLSFIRKVSARNLFRYKKRFWMTIVGIAGCTALLATGYGLRDSIFDVLTWQFDDLMPYNAAISISSDLTPSDRAELLAALRDEPGIADFTGCYEQTVDVRTGEGTVGNVVLHASADWKYVRDKAGLTEAGDPTGQSTQNSQKYTFDDYINLYPRGDGLRRYGSVGDLPKLTPTDEAIVIDEKLSTLLGIKEGDTVTLIDSDEAEYKAVVGGICENYVNHHIYMTHAYYKTVFGERPTNNLLLVKTILWCGSLFWPLRCWPSWSCSTSPTSM